MESDHCRRQAKSCRARPRIAQAISIYTFLALLFGVGKSEARLIASGGGGYSPTHYGGDTGGAFSPSARLSAEIGDNWTAGIYGTTVLYTDQVAVGRARFTVVGPEFLRFLSAGPVRPFLRASPDIVFAQWAPPTGTRHLVLGASLGAGVRFKPASALVCDAFGAYLVSDGTTKNIFDAPPRKMNGLSAFYLGIEVGLRLGNP